MAKAKRRPSDEEEQTEDQLKLEAEAAQLKQQHRQIVHLSPTSNMFNRIQKQTNYVPEPDFRGTRIPSHAGEEGKSAGFDPNTPHPYNIIKTDPKTGQQLVEHIDPVQRVTAVPEALVSPLTVLSPAAVQPSVVAKTPPVKVTFLLDVGELVASYRMAFVSDQALVLVLDSSCEPKFIPAVREEPMKVRLQDGKTYLTINPGLHFSLPGTDTSFIILLVSGNE